MQISNVFFNELLSGDWHLQLPTINFGKYQAVKYSLYNVLTMQEMFFGFSFLGIRGENWFNKLPHHHQNLVAHAIIFELKTSQPTFDQIVADAKFHLGMTENGT